MERGNPSLNSANLRNKEMSQSESAEMLNVSERSVSTAKKLERQRTNRQCLVRDQARRHGVSMRRGWPIPTVTSLMWSESSLRRSGSCKLRCGFSRNRSRHGNQRAGGRAFPRIKCARSNMTLRPGIPSGRRPRGPMSRKCLYLGLRNGQGIERLPLALLQPDLRFGVLAVGEFFG